MLRTTVGSFFFLLFFAEGDRALLDIL